MNKPHRHDTSLKFFIFFLLLIGAAGKRFIEETIKLVNSWTYKSDLKTIALKALMIMPGLLIQKDSLNSKSKENSFTLKRRLSLLCLGWKVIQDRVQNNGRVATNKNKKALTFSRLLEEGKVNKAIQILEKANKGGILPLSGQTFEILQQKHPEASKASHDIILK